MTVSIRRPTALELASMKALLARSGLPTDDFETSRIDWLVAVDAHGSLAGMVGLEVFDGVALLRSLVAASPRNGAGSQLLASAESSARAAGVAQIYLLTQTAADYFARRGYQRVDRSAAPPSLLQTSEFRSLCPASATCMMKEVS
jgi:amino-acid N-acetyltransferase